jgi:hypothetical protein
MLVACRLAVYPRLRPTTRASSRSRKPRETTVTGWRDCRPSVAVQSVKNAGSDKRHDESD